MRVGVANLLADLEPFESTKYESVDLDRLTAYGIGVLVRRKIPTTFENVVVALYRMFPVKFSLVGWPMYPDAARVNRALLHCLPKYRNYLAGGARGGYYLTNQGLGAAEETEQLLKSSDRPVEGRRKKPGTPRGVADQFMREVSEAEAFKKFRDHRADEIEEFDFHRILHAGPDTSVSELTRRLDQLADYAEQTDEHDVGRFLNWLRERFLGHDGT